MLESKRRNVPEGFDRVFDEEFETLVETYRSEKRANRALLCFTCALVPVLVGLLVFSVVSRQLHENAGVSVMVAIYVMLFMLLASALTITVQLLKAPRIDLRSLHVCLSQDPEMHDMLHRLRRLRRTLHQDA
jgi:hypothetical protein